MTFNITLDNFYLEDCDDIEEALKNHIIGEVVIRIKRSIQDKVDSQITQKVDNIIKEKIAPIIDRELTNLVATESITRNGDKIKISDHIKSIFERDRGWDNVSGQIDNLSKRFSQELKAQYDAAFANQVVLGLKEQGLLKDEVVKLLLK